ncbi:putative deacetylvindoline O-acetyltransferase-like [Capsicum annuum]|nr:putative deacetylvindoline O-acetyltransferase-like [Capsicum annuum]
MDAPVRRCERLALDGFRRGRGRPKKYWGEVIRRDMEQLQLTEDMTLDRKWYSTPEASLGFHPYCAFSYMLSRLSGRLGEYLGLTGERLRGKDVVAAGLATRFVPSQLEKCLLSISNGEEDVIRSVIDEFSTNVQIDERSILNKLAINNECFSRKSVEEIVDSFEVEAGKKGNDWIVPVLKRKKKASPTGLKITLKSWNPSTLDEVHDEQLDLIFKPFEEHDLELQIPVKKDECRFIFGITIMEPEASNAQTMDNNAINLILARLETMYRDVARLNVGLEKLDTDVASIRSKCVMAYYDEFLQLMLKLDHRGEKVSHDIVCFKVGLNKDIFTRMTLQKFDTIDGIFYTALEVGIESVKNDDKPQDGEQKEAKVKNEEYGEDVWPEEGIVKCLCKRGTQLESPSQLGKIQRKFSLLMECRVGIGPRTPDGIAPPGVSLVHTGDQRFQSNNDPRKQGTQSQAIIGTYIMRKYSHTGVYVDQYFWNVLRRYSDENGGNLQLVGKPPHQPSTGRLDVSTYAGYVVLGRKDYFYESRPLLAGIKVDPKKIETFKKWPRCTTPANIKSFLGLAEYYRRFVQGFSSIVIPLMRLTQNKTDGQAERTILTLEDMLRAFLIDFKGNWVDQLPLIEFAYNNSYHSSIQMVPFGALYDRRCKSPIRWFEVGETTLFGPNLVHQAMDR